MRGDRTPLARRDVGGVRSMIVMTESTTRPITISARNAESMVGMSWAWVKRFCAANGVPIYRVGERKQLVPAAPLLAAIERQREQIDDGADELAAMRARVARAGAR